MPSGEAERTPTRFSAIMTRTPVPANGPCRMQCWLPALGPGRLRTPSSSPSPSSFFEDDPVPVGATDEQGMIGNDERELPNGSQNPPPPSTEAVSISTTLKPTKRPRQPRKNVSRHFSTSSSKRCKGRSQLQSQEKAVSTMTPPDTPDQVQTRQKARVQRPPLEVQTPPKTQPRIINGVNIDEDFSSDSSLTSVPSDIGEDPFVSADLVAVKIRRQKRPFHHTKSPYFPHPHRHKPRPTFISSILPFPPLSTPYFGIMQERLAHDPFRLLLATIFLNKTPASRAMPVFYNLMARYPTPQDLATARVEDVVAIMRCLGFQNQRAKKCVAMARVWVGLDGGDAAGEPRRGRRWGKRDYPRKGDGRGMKMDEWVADEDEKVAWEISHLPGLGAYAHDSWRMFCRDKLRGVAEGWNGEGAKPSTTPTPTPNPTSTSQGTATAFEPEWKRVLPADKELRAWMTWMWLKEGWLWNKETGERTRASDELMEMARGGGVVREEKERECLVVEGIYSSREKVEENGLHDKQQVVKERLDKPAGAFMVPSLGNGNDEGGESDFLHTMQEIEIVS